MGLLWAGLLLPPKKSSISIQFIRSGILGEWRGEGRGEERGGGQLKKRVSQGYTLIFFFAGRWVFFLLPSALDRRCFGCTCVIQEPPGLPCCINCLSSSFSPLGPRACAQTRGDKEQHDVRFSSSQVPKENVCEQV